MPIECVVGKKIDIDRDNKRVKENSSINIHKRERVLVCLRAKFCIKHTYTHNSTFIFLVKCTFFFCSKRKILFFSYFASVARSLCILFSRTEKRKHKTQYCVFLFGSSASSLFIAIFLPSIRSYSIARLVHMRFFPQDSFFYFIIMCVRFSSVLKQDAY